LYSIRMASTTEILLKYDKKFREGVKFARRMAERKAETKFAEGKRSWHLFDGQNQIVGRMAKEIADRLMGKNKPTYMPHVDDGDFVVVVNCERVKFTGERGKKKVYYHHTGYPGGLRDTPVKLMMEKFPDRVVMRAVRGMLPRNKTREKRMERLKVYAGPSHPFGAKFKKAVDLSPAPTRLSLEEAYPSEIFNKDMDWSKFIDVDIKK